METDVAVRKVSRDAYFHVERKLRKAFPYLPTDSLTRIVEEMQSCIISEFEKEKGAMAAAKSRSSFFKLSAELRNRIYELALIRRHPTKDDTNNFDVVIQRGKGQIKTTKVPSLLSTCRQIRNEASPIYYGQNRFRVDIGKNMDPVHMTGVWLRSLEHDRAAMLTKVVLRFKIDRRRGTEDHEAALKRYLGLHWERDSVTKGMFVKALGLKGKGVLLDNFKIEVCDETDKAVTEVFAEKQEDNNEEAAVNNSSGS